MNKIHIYRIVLALILVGLIWSGYQYYQNNPPQKELTLAEITKLGEEERVKALEARIKDFSDQAKDLAGDAASAAKFKVYVQLAEAQLELRKYDDALTSLNSIPEDQRSNSRYGVALARAHKGKGELSKAKEISAANIKNYELEPSAWLAHVEIYSDLPNDQLNALYREAITKTKSNVDIMISYARFCERIGDKATAIAAWETAINGDPGNEAKYRAEIDRLKQ